MTAPLDLTDDERSLREAVRAMIGIGSTHFNLRADYLDQLLQKLSDARAALRAIKSRHRDMDHGVYCPGRKHDNGDCNCPDTDGLIHEGGAVRGR